MARQTPTETSSGRASGRRSPFHRSSGIRKSDQKVIILGLNAFHGDASAAIVRDGVLVAAAEEERFRRIKHWAGFPSEGIRYCLNEAGVSLEAVDVVAINQDSHANLSAKLRYLLSSRSSLSMVLERARNRGARESAASLLRREFPNAQHIPKIEYIEHHLAHLYSAFHVSGFGTATVVSLDGFGDFASAAWGRGNDETLAVEN